MKKIILLLTTAMLLYVSSSALEPVRIGLNYPTGSNFKVQLNDYTNPAHPQQIYPDTIGTFYNVTLSPNRSGVVSFVVGEGDPDWGGITRGQINPNVVIDVKVGPNLVAQFNLLEMITNQSITGNGNILKDGFNTTEGVTRPDSNDIGNDFIFGSVKLDRVSAVPETKFFFDHSKSAFRAGVVNTNSWNEINLGVSSFAAGSDTKASGVGSAAFGIGTSAPSYGEVAIGSYNTTYVPNSATAPDTNDRAFVIGNGTSTTPSDAFIINKNGNMTVGGTLTVLGATITNSSLNVGGTSIDPSTGNLVVAGTSTLNGDVSVTGTVTLPANAIQDSEVDNNITIDAGTVDNTPVGAGGASTGAFTTLSASGLTTLNDDVTIAVGKSLTVGTTITATTGDITATAGNINGVDGTFTGDVTATAGNIAATLGSVTAGTTVTAGTGVIATTGDITATAGNIVATAGSVTAGNGLTVTTGDTKLTSLATADNKSLYIDNTGLVTASNGANARQASGIFTGTYTTVAGTTQTIANTNVVFGSVIMITYYGNVVATYTLGAIIDKTSFVVEFSAALTGGESIHYMIINN